LFPLNTKWRVVGDDPSQWILQRYRTPRWRDHSFCRTREGLLRCVREYCGEVTALLRALSDWREVQVESPEAVSSPDSLFDGPDYISPLPPLQTHHIGPTPGALQGDDYHIALDANDGYPELPACLDRREPRFEEAA
jgi:hypothetical protein